ncbi:cellulose synthase/poly-beta-1,6-N-acetylglucosamine synthase-like glycosyltransferase [Aurantimonas endophytica]|uniref:Cellulose synthase/poly-beta-1,6-N-acetylglucosamine synthase-like glycosyltransferase n=1 Tax=Aurantimonas endophytica TaxID=1522175 RepID=A0A7W6HGL3_9HYPH|nr:cellulose synthase/poly-beta-1,6-N-acetylglucosamine synthase-like glycosyltransferase [Aurantimonas endophytica]MCO6405669.1 glycosyltransferase [Aurantimonas endophytica]
MEPMRDDVSDHPAMSGGPYVPPPLPCNGASGSFPPVPTRSVLHVARRPARHDEAAAVLGLEPSVIAEARAEAARNGTDLAAELVAAGHCDAETLAARMATRLALPVEAIAAGDRIIGFAANDRTALPRLVKTCDARLDTKLFLLPRPDGLARLRAFLAARPDFARRARVTTDGDVKRALAQQSERQRLHAATESLAATHPRQSARNVLEPAQAMVLTLLACGLLAAVAHVPSSTLFFLHLIVGTLFAAALCLRLAAVLGRVQVTPQLTEPDEPKPLYSVLVALHRERGVADRLIDALSRLDWPVSRLEIKIVCEADDPDTISVVEQAIDRRPQFEIVKVPASEPRTKPKALNFALPLTAGEFLVLYDAEDVPHPGQLREAYARFRSGPGELACLQAPLVVGNGGNNWLAGVFALEYAALFRRLLPWLGRHGLPMPLGGTSNHFVRARLLDVGGWDSHNVTEDADLGMRLCRKGYRIETIGLPTLEHAPEKLDIWFRQRTRWMKGWMQTYLVHMRQPVLLLRELGARRFLTFQLLFIGMLASSVAHPLFLAVAGAGLVRAVAQGTDSVSFGALLALDLFNAVGGYALFVALSKQALDKEEGKLVRYFPLVPIYWVMIAAATVRALAQLFTAPHRWEKTPHDMASRAIPHDARYRLDPRVDA